MAFWSKWKSSARGLVVAIKEAPQREGRPGEQRALRPLIAAAMDLGQTGSALFCGSPKGLGFLLVFLFKTPAKMGTLKKTDPFGPIPGSLAATSVRVVFCPANVPVVPEQLSS